MIGSIYARETVRVMGLLILVVVIAAPHAYAECAWVLWAYTS
jgi:hypothetical protein